MRIEDIPLNHADSSGRCLFRSSGIEFDAMTLDLSTFCDQIERGSLAGARIDHRAGEGKTEKRLDLSRFWLGQGKESHFKASGTACQMAPPSRIFWWWGGSVIGPLTLTVPAKLMVTSFGSEGAAFAGVNSEDSSRNHPRSMSSCRQGDLNEAAGAANAELRHTDAVWANKCATSALRCRVPTHLLSAGSDSKSIDSPPPLKTPASSFKSPYRNRLESSSTFTRVTARGGSDQG